MPVFGLQAQNFLTPGGAAQGFSNLGAALVQAPMEQQRLNWAQQQFQAEQQFRNKSLDQAAQLAAAHNQTQRDIWGTRSNTALQVQGMKSDTSTTNNQNTVQGRTDVAGVNAGAKTDVAGINAQSRDLRTQAMTNVQNLNTKYGLTGEEIKSHMEGMVQKAREDAGKQMIQNPDPAGRITQPLVPAFTPDQIETSPGVTAAKATAYDHAQAVDKILGAGKQTAPAGTPAPQGAAAPFQGAAPTQAPQGAAPQGKQPVSFSASNIPHIQQVLASKGINLSPQQIPQWLQSQGHAFDDGQSAGGAVQGGPGQ